MYGVFQPQGMNDGRGKGEVSSNAPCATVVSKGQTLSTRDASGSENKSHLGSYDLPRCDLSGLPWQRSTYLVGTPSSG